MDQGAKGSEPKEVKRMAAEIPLQHIHWTLWVLVFAQALSGMIWYGNSEDSSGMAVKHREAPALEILHPKHAGAPV